MSFVIFYHAQSVIVLVYKCIDSGIYFSYLFTFITFLYFFYFLCYTFRVNKHYYYLMIIIIIIFIIASDIFMLSVGIYLISVYYYVQVSKLLASIQNTSEDRNMTLLFY